MPIYLYFQFSTGDKNTNLTSEVNKTEHGSYQIKFLVVAQDGSLLYIVYI